ncbi:MAG: hypothetical protein AAB691_04965 [Patescibacteria group bacterium]
MLLKSLVQGLGSLVVGSRGEDDDFQGELQIKTSEEVPMSRIRELCEQHYATLEAEFRDKHGGENFCSWGIWRNDDPRAVIVITKAGSLILITLYPS